MVDGTQIEREQADLLIQMDESREALADKIERLEEKVTETVENATASVTEATASVLETVQNASNSVSETVDSVTDAVQGTVDSVRQSVEGTVDSVRGAFNITRQVEANPWCMFAHAVAVGYLGTTFLRAPATPLANSRNKTPIESEEMTESDLTWKRAPSAMPFDSSSNGYHPNGATLKGVKPEPAKTSPAPDWKSALTDGLGAEITKLQRLAVGVAMSAVRDMVVELVPPKIQKPLAEIFDDATEKLGGTSLR